ncbi:ExeA family protein [Planctomicrobium sp. SH668]|uniref:ExeA family protein n=1 Tax=Planctomicrobium sp. SH668 TaxID=3448126 RepID=UPI003F5C0BDF
MYEAHWKLSTRPFDDGALPEFYYPSQLHQTALLKLRYLIEQRKGLGVIAGEHGVGKSFLTHVLESELAVQSNPQFLRLSFPQLSPTAILAYFASRLGSDVNARDPEDVILRGLETQLELLQKQGQHVVFVIDDAHLLENQQINTLRLLLNLREDRRSDFSMILAGRTELLSRLQRVAAIDQRVSVRTALEPLTAQEVSEYVQHRLHVAGRTEPIFDSKANQSLWELTQGVPRRINQLCDLSLLVGFVDELKSIHRVEIEAAAEELISVAA